MLRLRSIAAIILLSAAATLQAHPTPLARASLQIDTAGQSYELRLECDVTAFIMRTSPGHLGDEMAAHLAALSDEELAADVRRSRQMFDGQFEVVHGGEAIDPQEIIFPPLETVREVTENFSGGFDTHQATITIRGKLGGLQERGRGADGSAAGGSLVLRFPRAIGAVLLVARRDEVDLAPQLLSAGQPSLPLPMGRAAAAAAPAPAKDAADPAADGSARAAGAADERPAAPAADEEGDGGDSVPVEVNVAGQFLALGFWHIIPTGPDHILFVLGLFLLSPTLKPLLWQVTAFTLAHSVTLALAMYKVVDLPAHIVEPLIAASIAYVAIENLFTTRLQPWRPIVVFAFGLLHGLGFAGVLTDLQVPREQFLPALVGFNLGVEAGQLAVIGLALLAVGWFRRASWYRMGVVIPASLAVAAVGIYWTIARVAQGVS